MGIKECSVKKVLLIYVKIEKPRVPQLLNVMEISPVIIVNNPHEDPISNIPTLPFVDQDWGISNDAFDLDIEVIGSQIPEECQMPFEYIFQNHLGGGIQHNSSEVTDQFQLHTIQNFEFLPIKKEFSFKPKFVNVVLLVVHFSDGALLITACSGCSSCQALEMYLPSGSCMHLNCPPYSNDRFVTCEHSAVVISILCDRHRITYSNSLQHIHHQLIQCLNTGGGAVECGWQNLNGNFKTDRGLKHACFLTTEYLLLCFNLSKKNDRFIMVCNTCNRTNCSHCRTASQHDYTEELPTNNGPNLAVFKRHTLISTKTYPFDYGGFVGDLTPSLTFITNEEIKARATGGLTYFSQRFPNHILEPDVTQICCLNQITPYVTYKVFIFTPQVFISNFEVRTYQCNLCRKSFHYDGREECLLNFDNRYIFCAELFYSLLDLKLRAGLSTYAWWNSLMEIYLRFRDYFNSGYGIMMIEQE